MKMIAFITEDGDPHSAFVYGHVDLDDMRRNGGPDAVQAAFLDFDDVMPPAVLDEHEPFDFSHFWLRLAPGHAEGDEDAMYEHCDAWEEGAFPVSGVRFLP